MRARSVLLLASATFVLAMTGNLKGQAVEVDLRLATLQEGFDGALDRDALQPRKDAMAAFNKAYLTTLDRALTTATQAGNLEVAVVLRAEKDRVEVGLPVPVGEDKKTLEVLKPVRDSVSVGLAKIDDDYLKRLRSLLDRYDQALAALQAEVTKAGKLDDGLRVKSVRDRVAKARIAGDIAQLNDAKGSAATSVATAAAAVPAMPKASIKSAKELELFLPGTVWTWDVPGAKGAPNKLRFDENGHAQLGNSSPFPWKAKDSRSVEWASGTTMKFNRDYTEFEATTGSGPRSGKRVAQ